MGLVDEPLGVDDCCTQLLSTVMGDGPIVHASAESGPQLHRFVQREDPMSVNEAATRLSPKADDDKSSSTGQDYVENSRPELHLPDAVVGHIANYVAAHGGSLLPLLSMCGVCKQWRVIARELNPTACVEFDSMDKTHTSQEAMQKFKKLSSENKAGMLIAAARLLSGYGEVAFAGDGSTDKLLLEVASRQGRSIKKCRVQSTSAITDAGLASFLSSAQNLKALTVEDFTSNSEAVTGSFLATVFNVNKQLHQLHLGGIPNLIWAPARRAIADLREVSLTKLHIRGVDLDSDFVYVLNKLSKLRELELDGAASTITAAALSCPELVRVSYLVSTRPQLREAVSALSRVKELKQLEFIVRDFTIHPDQLREIGRLPVVELRLDSFIYKQQPTFARNNYSHLDNDGVRALVDGICNRWTAHTHDVAPSKLSLCGATMLGHEAVSALLRLPILTELEIGGCTRIAAMDRMRLVAKVRAGRELLDSWKTSGTRTRRFPRSLV